MAERPDILEKLLNAAGGILPENLGEDIKSNLRAALKAALDDMDIVTREELDVQKEVLLKTRSKLEQLEEHLKQLQEVLLADSRAAADTGEQEPEQ